MTGTETKKAEQGLNEPKTNEEMFDAINTAVSEGNQEEVDRLMALQPNFEDSQETPPDATDDDEPSTDTPADKAGAGEEESTDDDPNKNSSETSAKPEAATDKAASVSDNPPKEPTLKELMDELHNLRSNVGRVDYLQARLTQLERQAKKAAKTPPASQESEKPVSRKSDERLTKLKDIDPDLAETLELIRNEVREELEAKYGKPAPAAREEADEVDTTAMEQEINRIERVHPELRQIFWGQYRPMWDNWKNSLTPEQRAWAESDKAEEVILAVTAFKQALATQNQQQTAAPDNKGGDPSKDEVTEPDPSVDATNKARERKLQGGSGTKQTTIKSQGAIDRDKLFNELYAQIQKDDHLS